MSLRIALRLRPVLLAVTLLGCGSTVDETPGGSGGSGGSSATGGGGDDAASSGEGAGTTTSTSGTASTSGTTGAGAGEVSNGVAECEGYCDVASQCSPGVDCVESCLDYRPDECGAEFAAIVACRTPFLASDCGAEEICLPEQAAYDACLATASPTNCFTTSSEGGGLCDGEGPCINGQTARMTCDEIDGAILCECYVDEVFFGKCEEAQASCDLDHSCCEQFF